MIVHRAEKDKINILLKTNLVKMHFSMCKLLLDFPAAVINYFNKLLQGLEMYYAMNDHHIRQNKHKHKETKTI